MFSPKRPKSHKTASTRFAVVPKGFIGKSHPLQWSPHLVYSWIQAMRAGEDLWPWARHSAEMQYQWQLGFSAWQKAFRMMAPWMSVPKELKKAAQKYFT